MVSTSGWNKWSLGKLVSETKTTIQTGPFGTVLSASEFVDYGIPVVSVREIREGFIRITDETPCVTEETFSRLSKYSLSEKDIVFARKGSVDRSALIPGGRRKYFLGSDGIRIRFDQDAVVPELMLYIFQSPSTKQFLVQSAYGTTMAGLNEKILCSLEFHLPNTVTEQRDIAHILKDIDKQLVVIAEMIDKKKTIKQGAMQELLTGKKRLPGFAKEWTTQNIPDILHKQVGIKIGPFGSQLKKEYLLDNGPYRVYGQENVYACNFSIGNRFLSRERFAQLQSCEIKEGDFLISTMGTIGKCAIVPAGIHKGIMDSHLIRLRIDKTKVLPEYLLHLFSEELGYLRNQTSKLSVGGIMDGLSTKIVNSLVVRCPEDIHEQETIAEILSNMDAEIKALEQKLAKYHQLKQGMMQQLLTGKIRLV
jgi:type I restriction enzyme S subunit